MTVSHGVLAVGDSLSTGFGLAVGGLSCWPWAGWLAWGLGEGLLQHAVNGATTSQVVADQLPHLQPGARLGCLQLGTNDLGALDPVLFAEQVDRVLGAVADASSVVVVATLPAGLRRSAQPWRETVTALEIANQVVRCAAAARPVVLVELEDRLTGPWCWPVDHRHPTAIGQLEAAEVAAQALAGKGVALRRPLPASQDVVPGPDEQRQWRLSPADRAKVVALRLRRRLRDAVAN